MGKKTENTPFICVHCFKEVLPAQNGFRNHCPFCLTSLHVDIFPGDRKSTCKGIMFAHKLILHPKKGWQIIHKCKKCRQSRVNVIAEGSVQPDNWDLLIKLSNFGD